MRSFLRFFFFFLLTLCLYYPARHARFVFDFIDWYSVYKSLGWRGFATDFHDVAFRPVLQLINYSADMLLGFNASAWLIVVAFFHAMIATVAYAVIQSLLDLSDTRKSGYISFFSVLLFLVSPYQTEVLVWGGDFFYLPAALFFIYALYEFLKYSQTGKSQHLSFYFLFFLLAVFSHEIAFTLPILVTLFIISLRKIGHVGQGRFKLFLKTVLPVLAFVPVYFVINKLTLGKWIGHYGAAAHLHFDVMEMIGKLNMYVVKFYLLAPFWKPHLYVWAQKPAIIYLSIFSLLAGGLALLLSLRNASLRSMLIFIFATVVLLAMVLNLYLVDFIRIQSDRLGYFASIFAFVPVAILVSKFPRIISYLIASSCMVLFIYTLIINIASWHHAGELEMSLDNDFKYKNANHLYILNLPDNYEGAYMYRCRAADKFAQKQQMLTGMPVPAKEIDVLSYNLISADDSVIVEKISDSTLKVSFTKWGSWFWRDTYGASDYQDDMVKVDIDDWNHSYMVTFKKKEAGDIFLYQAANQWRKVEAF